MFDPEDTGLVHAESQPFGPPHFRWRCPKSGAVGQNPEAPLSSFKKLRWQQGDNENSHLSGEKGNKINHTDNFQNFLHSPQIFNF